MLSKKLFNAGVVFLFLLPALAHGAELDVGLSFLKGVSDKTGVDLSLKAETGILSGSAKIKYAEQDGDLSENQGQLQVGYDPVLSGQWSLWFYDELGYDTVRDISLENFAGGGPKYVLHESAKAKYSVSAGYLNHYRELADGTTEDMHRLSFRFKARQWLYLDVILPARDKIVGSGPEINVVVFYQPNVEDFDDYIMTGELSVKYGLSKQTSLKLKVEDKYRSTAIADAKNELRTVVALSINF